MVARLVMCWRHYYVINKVDLKYISVSETEAQSLVYQVIDAECRRCGADY